MGKLRTEPKAKSLLNDNDYDKYKEILEEAQDAADDHDIFFDLEEGEQPAKVRKALSYVAEQEGIVVKISRKRGEDSLVFNFKTSSRSNSNRMSAEESRRRILNALKDAKKPIKKGEIISKTNISASTWNIRVKELVDEGKVVKDGERRDTVYSLPK